MGQFHGLHNTLHDHRRAQTCSKPEKKHAFPVIMSQCLHGCVIDDFDRTTKGLRKIETHPAAAQIVWLTDDAIVHDRPWIADGYCVYLPVTRMFLDGRHHSLWRHFRTRWDDHRLPVRSGLYFDMRAPDINN